MAWQKFDANDPPLDSYFLMAPKGTTHYDHLQIVRRVGFYGVVAYQGESGRRVNEDHIGWWHPLPGLPKPDIEESE